MLKVNRMNIKSIVKEAVELAFKDESSKKRDDIPRVVNFTGQWVVPDEKHIEDELKLAACLFNSNYKLIINKMKKTTPKFLSDDLWKELDNTLSWNVTTLEKAQEIADEYGYHYNDSLFGFKNNRDMNLPVIVIKKDLKPYLVSGETELLFAGAFKIKPKVLIINL